ncbi:E3 SUMO-protein ligase ZBED1 [Halictus rubicundus]|uniref:E3 SUMO-protein ligase ZBED1 n=1 Tax=Halictus rubicundus TaxID=77578 RepID=UPI004036A292
MPKVRVKRSAIWSHFSEYSEHDRSTIVKCNTCNVALPYCRNTTNLWSHVRIHHKSILNGTIGSSNPLEAERQNSSNLCSTVPSNNVATECDLSGNDAAMPAPSSPCDTVQQYPPNSKRAQEITNSLLIMIAAEVYPFSIVNGKEFIDFVRTLDERYTLPNRTALTSKYLPALYLSRCKEIMDKLSNVECVHLAIDSWTDVNRKMSFLSITAYFCGQETLRDNTLQVSYVPSRHDTECLNEIVSRTADAWKITSKVKTVVYDRANNIPGASTHLPWRKIFCFASTLSMVVHNAFADAKTILNVFNRCRDIVDLSKSNHAVVEALRYEKIRQNYPKPLTLRRDVPGQWKSTYLMLCNLLDLRSILSVVLTDLSHRGVLRIAQDEWEIVSGVIQVLKPIYEATEEVSGDSNVAISKIIPIVHCIQAALENQGELPADVTLLRVNLLNELAARFEDIETHPVYSFATFLDPRYKNIAFHSYECVLLVRNQLMSRCRHGESGNNDSDARVRMQQVNDEITEANDTLWAEFDKKVQEAAAETECSSNSLKDELERYLRLKLINRKSNPISWWNTDGKALFPKLMKVALEYLCIPATCVSKEPIFSKVAQILAHRKTRIQAKYVNMLSVLNLNQNK